MHDLWIDFSQINSGAQERLGSPTQKPEALLDRIIATSSGDVVLDAFCACGTAIASAQHLNRRWVGIDITHLAAALINNRLHDAYVDAARFEVIGGPTTESQIILSVKAGYLHATRVRDLVGVVQREKAAIGALISFESPT